MDSEETVPSLVSISAKKKSKKSKKRKHDGDGEAGATPDDVTRERSKKKKKKSKKRSREEHTGDVDAHDEKLQSASDSDARLVAAHTSQTGAPSSIFSILSAAAEPNASRNSPYQVKLIQGTVALLPSSLSDVPGRIKSLLHSLLLMYDAKMGGMLLSLEEGAKLLPFDHNKRTRFRGGAVGGRVVDDLPYVHFSFQVRGLLFCPEVNMKLKGQVVECTPTYITLTSHNILSTKISQDNLNQMGFFYNDESLEWTRERSVTRPGQNEDESFLGPSTSIYLDDCVEFLVERVHECGGYVSLDGKSPDVSSV
ncbi:hypothetical protein THAOC_31395 [Thalassiosira oceanica]|uniref:RPA43 OB domain-containing protein n=1 Tax=Thalassiosira oceanica TaxID=159749 RepID=K0RSV8_THAOC|nr:hypothetical protein THAOC_31395 [Thalassiosira oceanica]|eukprot:EJK49697.1 hypothetical protein THAOC_31395 [Thalassiosira oceanica]